MRGRPLTSNRWKVEINQRRRHARTLVRIHGGSRGGGGRLRAGRRRLGPGQLGRPARSEEREESRRQVGQGDRRRQENRRGQLRGLPRRQGRGGRPRRRRPARQARQLDGGGRPGGERRGNLLEDLERPRPHAALEASRGEGPLGPGPLHPDLEEVVAGGVSSGLTCPLSPFYNSSPLPPRRLFPPRLQPPRKEPFPPPSTPPPRARPKELVGPALAPLPRLLVVDRPVLSLLAPAQGRLYPRTSRGFRR